MVEFSASSVLFSIAFLFSKVSKAWSYSLNNIQHGQQPDHESIFFDLVDSDAPLVSVLSLKACFEDINIGHGSCH